MTKKQEETQTLLGLVAQAHPDNSSLIRYSSAGHTSTAITKTEERIEREAHKQALVAKLQADKTRRAEHHIREMHDTAADKYHGLIEHEKAIKQTFTGDEYDVYTDKFNHVNAQMAARHLQEAVEVGAGRVIDEIGRSLYLKEEERRGIFRR